jgi:peptidyl-prolyl cis-trans isomerase B (cyclophilin B)
VVSSDICVRALAAVILTLALTGCGDQAGPSSDAETSAATESPRESPRESPTESAGSAPTTDAADGACDYTEDGQQPAKKVDLPPKQPSVSGELPALLATNAGDIGVMLDADAAPCTVNSFVSLAGQGYFDDTPCHRLTTAASGIFVLQCGDPTGSGMGGPGYTIPDELTGQETYPAGTLAMARTQQPHSGGSQFFLVYDDTPLPPDYTVFGHLESDGLKVLKQIAAGGTADGGPDGAPKKPVTIESVTFSD